MGGKRNETKFKGYIIVVLLGAGLMGAIFWWTQNKRQEEEAKEQEAKEKVAELNKRKAQFLKDMTYEYFKAEYRHGIENKIKSQRHSKEEAADIAKLIGVHSKLMKWDQRPLSDKSAQRKRTLIKAWMMFYSDLDVENIDVYEKVRNTLSEEVLFEKANTDDEFLKLLLENARGQQEQIEQGASRKMIQWQKYQDSL